ncbi:MAG TPA: hypothetical protein VIU12_11330 [Chryseolinea sp.]
MSDTMQFSSFFNVSGKTMGRSRLRAISGLVQGNFEKCREYAATTAT